MIKDRFLQSKTITEIILKTILVLILINLVYVFLIFGGNILLDNNSANGSIFLIGNMLLIVLSIKLGCVIKKNNYQHISENKLKKLSMFIAFMLAFGTIHFFFIRPSGMNIAGDSIVNIRNYMELNNIESSVFTRFIIHIIDQFFLWTPVNVTMCLGAVFNCLTFK